MDQERAAVVSRDLAEVHRAGQERLGLTVALVAFFAWLDANQNDPNNPGLTDEAVEEILDIAQQARRVSHRLSARYYNLARAVGTGSALPDIDNDFTAGSTTLQQVYAAMASSLNEVAELADLDFPADTPEAGEDQGDDRTMSERLDDLEDAIIELFSDTIPDNLDESVVIETIEDWDWPELDEREAEDDLLAELEDLEQEQMRRAEQIRAAEELYNKTIQRLEEFERTQAAKAAGQADLNVLRPGRDLIHDLGDIDPKRLAWMRVTGPSPCAFCAMLASRGAVYRSQRSALFDGYGRLYHPNCHCTVIPVFTDDPAYSARDRYFMDNWEPATKGYSGRAALNAWRRWLRKQYKAGLVPDQHSYGPARPEQTSLEES